MNKNSIETLSLASKKKKIILNLKKMNYTQNTKSKKKLTHSLIFMISFSPIYLLLFIQIHRHHMIFFEICYFFVFVYDLALEILQFLFCNDPIVVDFFSFLLIITKNLFFIINICLQGTDFLSKQQLFSPKITKLVSIGFVFSNS